MKHFCVLFAGAVGSSKTPVANYLSMNLGLPVFSNDAIRTEVREDIGRLEVAEYERRQQQRFERQLELKRSFIYDSGVDRRWLKVENKLKTYEFARFLTSFDLSPEFLIKLYVVKDYDLSIIDKYYEDHQNFLRSFNRQINLPIPDEQFLGRLNVALQTIRGWIASDGAWQ